MPRATVFARLAPLVVALAPVVLGQGVTGRGGRQDRSTGTASGENSEYVHAHWLPPTPCVVAHTGALPATSVVAVALLSTVVALILLTYCFNRFCRSRASGGAYLSRVVPGEHSQRTLAVPAAVSRFRAEYLVQTAPMQPKDIPLGKPLFSVCPYEVYRASPAGNPENVAKLSDEGHRIEFDGPDDAVATAQAQTPLALELNHSQRVYWEVRIDAFENAKDRAMRRKDEAHQQRKALVKDGFQMLKKRGSSFFGRSVVAKNDGELAGASVSIGWATHLYPSFRHVGVEDFSVGLQSDGTLITSTISDGLGGVHGGAVQMTEPFRAGDVIGCGMERVGSRLARKSDQARDGRDRLVFFFTHNGRRLDPPPGGLGFIDLKRAKVERTIASREEVPTFNLLGEGCAFPTVAVCGRGAVSIVMDPGDFVYSKLKGEPGETFTTPVDGAGEAPESSTDKWRRRASRLSAPAVFSAVQAVRETAVTKAGKQGSRWKTLMAGKAARVRHELDVRGMGAAVAVLMNGAPELKEARDFDADDENSVAVEETRAQVRMERAVRSATQKNGRPRRVSRAEVQERRRRRSRSASDAGVSPTRRHSGAGTARASSPAQGGVKTGLAGLLDDTDSDGDVKGGRGGDNAKLDAASSSSHSFGPRSPRRSSRAHRRSGGYAGEAKRKRKSAASAAARRRGRLIFGDGDSSDDEYDRIERENL